MLVEFQLRILTLLPEGKTQEKGIQCGATVTRGENKSLRPA